MTWRTYRLGDVLTLKRGHDLPSDARVEGDIPVISSSGITGYHNQAKAAGPGVVTGRYGTLGEVYYVEQDYWPLNTSLYVVDFKACYPRFAAFLLRNVLRNYQSDKAAVPGVDRNVLHELKVRAPDRMTQEAISGVLATYEDLIENNTRRISLLEQAARLLYEEWFVRLRFPGREHSKLTTNSSLGQIATGWSVTRLGEITTKIGSGATPRGGSAAYQESGITLIRSLNVYDYTFVDDGIAYLTDEQADSLSNVQVAPRDILLNITGASVARCCMVPERHLPARVNQHVMIVRTDAAKADPHYVLCAINSDNRKRQLLSYAQKGATREALTKEMIEDFEIVLPDPRLLRRFCDLVTPMFQQRDVLAHQNVKLRHALDLLLPRLMSGEVAV